MHTHRPPCSTARQIVTLALPPRTHAYSADQKRLDALRAYSLVSTYLCDVAQPLLFGVVELDSVAKVEAFLMATPADLGELVKVLRFMQGTLSVKAEHVEADVLRRFAERCPHVVELFFFHRDLDLPACEPFTGLRRLFTSASSLTASRPLTLPSLVELSFDDSQVDLAAQTSLFSPSSMPSLRAVALSSLYAASDFSRPPPLRLDLLIPFFQHLDTFSCDLECTAGYPALQGQPRVLTDYEIDPPDDAWDDEGDWVLPLADLDAVKHLRLHAPFTHIEDIPTRDLPSSPRARVLLPSLMGVAEAIEAQKASCLQTLYLPGNMRPPSGRQRLFKVLRRILRLCASRKIAVVFEASARFRHESVVSPDFWRRCKALKAREEEDDKAQAKEAGRQG
ncbi:hypothetical protein JCM10213_003808 [Rhodosporidiobolus nylandii]